MRHKAGNGHNVEVRKFFDDLRAVVRDGEELLKVGAAEVKHRAAAGAQTTDHLVRQHPYESLGIMFGLGVLVGLIVTGAFFGSEPEHREEHEPARR